MAMVHLTDLLATDKNLCGLIPVDVPCTLKVGDFFKEKCADKSFLAKMEAIKPGTPIKTVLEAIPDINSPEWLLRSNGAIENFVGPYCIKDDIKFVNVCMLDITSWLKTLDESKIRDICKTAFSFGHYPVYEMKKFLELFGFSFHDPEQLVKEGSWEKETLAHIKRYKETGDMSVPTSHCLY